MPRDTMTLHGYYGNNGQTADELNRLGITQAQQGNVDAALDHFQQALEITMYY